MLDGEKRAKGHPYRYYEDGQTEERKEPHGGRVYAAVIECGEDVKLKIQILKYPGKRMVFHKCMLGYAVRIELCRVWRYVDK